MRRVAAMQFTRPQTKLFVIFLVVMGSSLLIFACKPGLPTTDLLQTTTPLSETLPVLTPSPESPMHTNTVLPPSTTPSPTNTEVIQSTASPTPTPKVFDADIKLAYTEWVMEGDQVRTIEYWILEPPYEVPRKVAEIEYGGYSEPQWSHSGDKIAFAKEKNNQISIVVVNVDTLEEKNYNLPVGQMEPGLSHVSWSYDDRWLALAYIIKNSYLIDKTVITDRTTHESRVFPNGVEFCDWFREPEDQFVNLEKTISTPYPSPEDSPVRDIAIQIQRLGKKDTISVIDDMGEYTPEVCRYNIRVSPDGKIAIAESSNGDRENIIQIDLQTGSWKLLFSSKGDNNVGEWSPDGRWLVRSRYPRDYFWDFYYESEPSENAIPVQDLMNTSAWAGDSQWLVYQDGNSIYAVSPLDDQSPIKIFDLPDLPEFTYISLWVE